MVDAPAHPAATRFAALTKSRAPPAGGRGWASGLTLCGWPLPSRLREGLGVGSAAVPTFKPRNTKRARELRNRATPAERVLWRYLSKSQLGVKFSRQMPVGPYFADFLCRERKLIVELDGWSHDVAPERDVVRERFLRGQGYRLLRFMNEDVRGNVEGVVTAIRLALREGPPRCD
ncbi:endonuclease domain-containing protein [Altererythrobacter sp. C41]|uniref:endonuclease domain-containing protein n=1 Tax=Altererythrobacter sp. C41 TaxID=2806021 RepID=UPI001EE477D6|nr:DUF559 domain-containing protein [Altererythrobacter sp. C41]